MLIQEITFFLDQMDARNNAEVTATEEKKSDVVKGSTKKIVRKPVNVSKKKGMKYIEAFLTTYNGDMSLLKEIKYWDLKKLGLKGDQNHKKSCINNIGDEVTRIHLTELVRKAHGEEKAKEFEQLAKFIRNRRDGKRSKTKVNPPNPVKQTVDIIKVEVNEELEDVMDAHMYP